MKVIAINGSPRKGWNTHILLTKALEGAASVGAQTELYNIYDYDFKGCISCLGCKLKGGNIGRCVVKDPITPVLDSIADCDAFILGSPIYLHEVTGELRSFIERLVFQYISYDVMGANYFGRKIKTALIFTTNCPEPMYDKVGYTRLFDSYVSSMNRIFGECKTLAVSETWQVNDYDKFHMASFDVAGRRKRREEVFPLDCKNAFAIGEWAAVT